MSQMMYQKLPIFEIYYLSVKHGPQDKASLPNQSNELHLKMVLNGVFGSLIVLLEDIWK